MTRITVIGSLNYDLVTFTDKVPEGGETYQAVAFETHLGGKGLNEALAVAKLSANNTPTPVRMIGNVGDDQFGQQLRQVLLDHNVDATEVRILKGISSGTATILVETSGENRIMIVAGANGELKPTESDYEGYFPDKQATEYVILQNEYPDTLKTINWIHKHRPNINVCYNPSPFQPELITEDVLSKIDFLIVNEVEAKGIAERLNYNGDIGYESLTEGLFKSLNPRNIQTVVITLGSQGSLLKDKSTPNAEFVPAVKVDKVVDTTGAGDTFFGGLVSNLARGVSLTEAGKFATIASSLAIQSKGAAESIPSYNKVISQL
ncbi:ribokinase [Scheffersomyces amazonensis]|uniref:ribokinase n=1 Tax=Scheffersomyces amazonensis TaxID=1078765 RepID=UPI00315D9D50